MSDDIVGALKRAAERASPILTRTIQPIGEEEQKRLAQQRGADAKELRNLAAIMEATGMTVEWIETSAAILRGEKEEK